MRNAAAEKILSVAQANGLTIRDAAFAEFMDNADALKEHRQKYHFPKHRDGTPMVYMCGNSLGLQHKDVQPMLEAQLSKWREQAVEGHFSQPTPWFEIESTIAKDMAEIVGAKENEVTVMNSLTVNMHLLMMAFYKPNGKRRKILCENQPFPSDTHALNSQLEVRGLNPEEDLIHVLAPGQEDWTSQPNVIPTEAFLTAIEKRGDEIALVLISAVHFLTGQYFDIPAITAAAHAKGITIGVDCAHGVGNVPLYLHDWGVDFAFWCTYKYLNGGPGSVGGLFVHNKHTMPGTDLKWLRGWWGHDRRNRFSLHRSFEPAEGAAAFQLSTASATAITQVKPSIKLMAEVGVEKLREKSLLLTAYLELLVNELVPAGCVEIITPADPAQRGAQLSVRILPNRLKSDEIEADSYECGTGTESDADIAKRQLIAHGVILDNRPPDIVRISPAPLYNSFSDVLRTALILASLF